MRLHVPELLGPRPGECTSPKAATRTSKKPSQEQEDYLYLYLRHRVVTQGHKGLSWKRWALFLLPPAIFQKPEIKGLKEALQKKTADSIACSTSNKRRLHNSGGEEEGQVSGLALTLRQDHREQEETEFFHESAILAGFISCWRIKGHSKPELGLGVKVKTSALESSWPFYERTEIPINCCSLMQSCWRLQHAQQAPQLRLSLEITFRSALRARNTSQCYCRHKKVLQEWKHPLMMCHARAGSDQNPKSRRTLRKPRRHNPNLSSTRCQL